MKKQINQFLIILFVIFNLNGFAQSPRFDAFKVLKNKKNVDVNTIFQDSSSFIWIGTNYGIVKYDGIDFTLYTINDNLFDNEVSTIKQDNQGDLWIGHKSGKISIYSKNKFIRFNPEEGLSNELISSFYIDSDTIWFSTFGEGVYYYSGLNKKRLYNINSDDGLLNNFVYSIASDSEGNLYFGTDLGISIYNKNKKAFIGQITMSVGLPDNIVKHLVVNGDNLWIGMDEGGICTYNIIDKKISRVSNWEFGSVNCFVCLSDNEIWVSTAKKGIVKINYDKLEQAWYTVYNREDELPDKRTNTVFTDREKNIWIGTRNGLAIRKNNNIEFLNEKEGFDIKNIFNIIIDDFGSIWIASQDGLYIVSKGKMGEINQKLLFHDPENPYSFISLYKDYLGNIWAGTYGYGIFIINPVTLEISHFTSKDGLSNDNIIHISGNPEFVWLSTLGGGVTKYCVGNINEFKTFTTTEGLTSDYVYSTFTDSEKRTWIATDGGGVEYFKDNQIHQFLNPKLDSVKKTVYAVIEDCNKNIWFNCANHGLYMYDGKSFFNFNEENGLRSNFIQGLTTDFLGNPVIISNEGIDKYNVKDSTFVYHGESDHVAYMEPNLNSVYKDNQGNIWIGTATGLIKLNTETDTAEIKPKIFITQKSVFFNALEEDKHTFSHNENHLSFYYTGLWFKSPESLMYRYKLKGYDIDWNMPTKSRMVTYSNLPPGNYSFTVQVNYSGGKWISSPDSEFSFKIRKPFWQTFWFISVTVLALIAGVLLYIKMRLQNLERAKDILEMEVVKRTAEIQHQKEEIEAQRDEIELQRNRVTIQKDKIELQNKNITSSIEYASRIQKAVLPPLESFKKFLGDHFIFFKPRDIVSGDFYYLNVKNDKIIVAAADCTGHGVPGAFMSMLGISLLNQIVSMLPETFDAGLILTLLREEIKKALRQTGKDNEAKDGMDISLCVFNSEKKEMNFAGAYNPLILVRNNELIKYKGDKMPVGIHFKEKENFTNHAFEILDNDMLYLYSDGFQDQFGGENKRKFLPANLNNLLLEIYAKPIIEQKEILERTFDTWKGEEFQVDDVIVLGFRI